MEQGMVFTEYEQVAKRRPTGDCSIAQLPESGERNRFQDVLPYDDTRVELVPTKENNTGYINASHIRVMLQTTYTICLNIFSKMFISIRILTLITM